MQQGPSDGGLLTAKIGAVKRPIQDVVGYNSRYSIKTFSYHGDCRPGRGIHRVHHHIKSSI